MACTATGLSRELPVALRPMYTTSASHLASRHLGTGDIAIDEYQATSIIRSTHRRQGPEEELVPSANRQWPESPSVRTRLGIRLTFALVRAGTYSYNLIRTRSSHRPAALDLHQIGHYVENAIRNAIIKFEQEFMGRGPDEVRAYVVRDLVVVRLKGVLTPAERQLAKTVEGIDMVKRLRQNLIAQGRDKLCEQVSEITGAKTLALFTDIDVQLSERVFVFTVDREIQNGLR